MNSPKLFSERNEGAALSWNIADLGLASLVREGIVVTVAMHSDAINRGMAASPAKIAAGGSPRAGNLWRSIVRTIFEGPLDQVFDVLETVWGMLPDEARKEFSGRVNHLFEEAELPWRLRRGNVRFLYLIYERPEAG